MEQLYGILGTLLVFGAIIAIHEFGHFIVAKMSGMLVHEYSLGFGPALFKTRRGDTLYALRIIPLGGYVRIAGMDTGDEEDAALLNSYAKKPFIAKFLTIAAGATMNFVLAFLAFLVIGLAIGYPTGRVVVNAVLPNSPAAQAGLQPQDRIIRIGNEANPRDPSRVMIAVVTTKPPIKMVVERDGARHEFNLTPRKAPGEKGAPKIGISMGVENFHRQTYGVGGSIMRGVEEVVYQTRLMFISLGMMVTGKVGFDGMMGPPQIIATTHSIAKHATTLDGQYSLLMWLGMISMNIGLLNLLPIPALDGSRLVFLTIERIMGKPFDRKKEEIVHTIGMLLLLGLIALISVREVYVMISNALRK